MRLRFLHSDRRYDFMRWHKLCFAITLLCMVGTVALVFSRGLNLGIDFTGGLVMEIRLEQPAPLSEMREWLQLPGVGDVSLQNFGSDRDVMLRFQVKEDIGQEKLVAEVKSVLEQHISGEIEYRKVDYVGPQVSDELLHGGILAMVLSLAGIMAYIWFRFEWQFGFGGILALVHDAVITVGFMSLLQLEFNLTSIAAVLTIIGYSINDSVVIYDRIRENLRKYKKMPLYELINLSLSETLSRTILTVSTVLLSLAALIFVGGDVIRSFSLAMFFGVVAGTYSSIFISAPILIYLNLRREEETPENAQAVKA